MQNENIFDRIVNDLELGPLLKPPQRVTGGYLHQMYRLETRASGGHIAGGLLAKIQSEEKPCTMALLDVDWDDYIGQTEVKCPEIEDELRKSFNWH